MVVTKLVLELLALKLKLKVFLASHTVAMVMYCVTKMIACSPMIGQLFDTVIVASTGIKKYKW